MPDFVKLPSERVEQLRRLSKKLDMTIADCIGMFVNEQIEKGNLEPDLPGIVIERAGKKIKIGTDDWERSVKPEIASKLSQSIRAMITPSKDNPFMPLPDFDLLRRGTSIKLRDPKTGAVKTFAPSIARDVADRLDEVSKS